MVAADPFSLNGGDYLPVVDYYSCFTDTYLLSSTTSAAVISHMKSIFGCHGTTQVPNLQVRSSQKFPLYTSVSIKCQVIIIQDPIA